MFEFIGSVTAHPLVFAAGVALGYLAPGTVSGAVTGAVGYAKALLAKIKP